MPYRRLPKTDAARLKALKTLLDNDNIYTVRNKIVDWKLLNKARLLCDKLQTTSEQHHINTMLLNRQSAKTTHLRQNAVMYVSHFIQVLFMATERGEIKKQQLQHYGITPNKVGLPETRTAAQISEWTPKIIKGEKYRIKEGGRPIYNPTINMVATHYDLFADANKRLEELKTKAELSHSTLKEIRPEVDELLLEIWNQIETHYKDNAPETRFAECRKLGIVYYYRNNEQHIY